MKRLNKTTLLIATILITGSGLKAQTISGKVTDSLTGVPLSNATVGLVKNGADIGTINAANGGFMFNDLDTAALYTLSIRFTGYREQVIANLSGKQQGGITVQLVPDQKEMAGVTVSSNKPFIVQKNDKILSLIHI